MTNEEFESLVQDAADKGLDLTLPNSSSTRAAFVMQTLFTKSNKSIKLLVNDLDSEITKFPHYNDSLEGAINRGVKIEVLFRKGPNPNSETNKLLSKYSGNNNIVLKSLSKNQLDKLNTYDINNGREFFFSIVDGKMFRFEHDKNNHQAYFNFNNETIASRLTNIFESIKTIVD